MRAPPKYLHTLDTQQKSKWEGAVNLKQQYCNLLIVIIAMQKCRSRTEEIILKVRLLAIRTRPKSAFGVTDLRYVMHL